MVEVMVLIELVSTTVVAADARDAIYVVWKVDPDTVSVAIRTLAGDGAGVLAPGGKGAPRGMEVHLGSLDDQYCVGSAFRYTQQGGVALTRRKCSRAARRK